MKKLTLLLLSCLCLASVQAQQKTDSLLKEYQKIAQNYQYKGKIDTIFYSDKIGVDTLFFREGNPFYINDNKLELSTRKSLSKFIASLTSNYGKHKLVEREADGVYGDAIFQWKNVKMDKFQTLTLNVGVRINRYEANCDNKIEIQVLNSDRINILRNNSDTLQIILNHFKQLINSTILNQADSFKIKKSAFQMLNLASNYEQVKNLISYPKTCSEIEIVEKAVKINEQGKIVEYQKDSTSFFEQILKPFISKLQYPILVVENQAIKYESQLRFEFAPNQNSIEKTLLDTLQFYTNEDSFALRTENYGLMIGNLFHKNIKHALLSYKLYESGESMFDFDSQFVLFQYIDNQWVKQQTFSVYGRLKEEFEDFNGDGHNDLFFQQKMPEDGGGNANYALLIYDTVCNCFKDIKEYQYIEQTEHFIGTENNQHFIGTFASGGNYGISEKQLYQWRNGKLELIKGATLFINTDNESNSFYQDYEVKNRVKIYGQVQEMKNEKAWEQFNSAIWKQEQSSTEEDLQEEEDIEQE